MHTLSTYDAAICQRQQKQLYDPVTTVLISLFIIIIIIIIIILACYNVVYLVFCVQILAVLIS